jgi:sugar/nucleoside kinase (ribokinase family)
LEQDGPELWCIGNALVDIFEEVEGDLDVLFGLSKPVQHLEYGQLSEILALLNDFSASAGGGAANVAKIAAMLGVSAGFTGALGSRPGKAGEPGLDRFARLFEGELGGLGVKLHLARSPRPTGVFLMLKNSEGETRIAVAPSAAADLGADDIHEDDLRRARVAVLDGYLLGRKELVRRVLDLADRYGTVIALDLGSAELARTWAAEILAYAGQYPLIFFMNEDEAASFYEALGSPGTEDEHGREPPPLTGERRRGDPRFRRICSFFRTLTGGNLFPIMVVKRGPHGAVVFAGGDVHRAETLPIIPLETTGAGDAFCAAFLAAWTRNRSLTECAALGNRAAREVLDVPGTRIDPRRLAHLARQLRPSPGKLNHTG